MNQNKTNKNLKMSEHPKSKNINENTFDDKGVFWPETGGGWIAPAKWLWLISIVILSKWNFACSLIISEKESLIVAIVLAYDALDSSHTSHLDFTRQNWLFSTVKYN